MAAFKKHAKVGVWTDARPALLDVTSLTKLPPAKVHAQQLQARITALLSSKSSSETRASTTPAKKTAAKKKAAKKKAAKKTAVKKKVAKKTAVKKARPAR